MNKNYTKVTFKDVFKHVTWGFAVAAVLWIVIKTFSYSSNDDGDKQYQNYMTEHYKIFSPVIPETLDFGGEPVPVENFDVREALDKELLKTMYWHSETFLYIKRANRFFPIIEPILAKHGIPDDFKYLALAESGLQNAVSPANAVGYWQFLRATGKEFGLEINSEVDERYHIEKSTNAACLYLKNAYRKYRSWALVAASYNMGQGALDRDLSWQNVDSYYDLLLNRETSRYVYRILAYKLILEKPKNFGFRYRKKDLYPEIKTKTITVDSGISDLVSFAKSNSINYKVFKILNPWLRKTSLSNKYKKTYKIKLPLNNARDINYYPEMIDRDTVTKQ